MSLKLNSLDKSIYESNGTQDVTVRVNGKDISRRQIVSVGRHVAVEYMGGKLNECVARENAGEKFVSRYDSPRDFNEVNKAHTDDVFAFCAALAYKAVGREAPASVADMKKDLSLATDRTFLNALSAITVDVIQPVMFSVYSDVAARGFMQWEEIPFGQSKAIEIRSNDVFLFEDSSWGSSRSASYNELFDKTLVLTPKLYTTQAKIKWYQNIVNGDMGAYYAAIMGGMWNKIYAILMEKLASAANNTDYIPAGLTASTYTTTNFNQISSIVAAANGVSRSDLVAFGKLNALSKILPTDGTGAAITGLQYGLGEKWFERGYLPNAGGVQLIEIPPVIIPGTQNSTLGIIDTGSNIYIGAKAGMGYAPFYGGFYEGSPITLTLTPRETRDFTIDLNVTATFDIKPVFASKVGVITNVA